MSARLRTPQALLSPALAFCLAMAAATSATASAVSASSKTDPRIKKIEYSPDAVVTVYTKRGQGTHLVLAPDEEIIGSPATGQGSNCSVPTDTWCVAVAETGRDIILKPREGAETNNLLLVTTKRRYAFELVPVADGRAAMRVVVTLPTPPAPPQPPVTVRAVQPDPVVVPVVPPPMSAEQLVANRMRATPLVRNGEYSVAEGKDSSELVPRLVFDDGRFTYFRFAGNLPLPAVFATASDGSEETVNTVMTEDGLLRADRVTRRFLLRAGNAVVAVINEAFDPDGAPAIAGTAVPGVARVLIAQPKHQRGAQ